MSVLDFIFETQTTRIFKMVSRLTKWTLGLDERLTKIEQRLGAIEMGLEAKGIHVEQVDDDSTSEKGG